MHREQQRAHLFQSSQLLQYMLVETETERERECVYAEWGEDDSYFDV